MAKKKLTSYVHVNDPENGRSGVFGPDDDLPDWAEKLITNPDAFEPQEESAGQQASGAYSDQTVDELKAELSLRDLPVSGNKSELVDRLEQDDREKASTGS